VGNLSLSPLPGGSEEQQDFYHYYCGMVYRFDANNGELIWQTPVSPSDQPNGARLHAVNGVVYAVGRFDIDAVNAQNGELLWHVSYTGERRYFSSIIDNGRIYLYLSDLTFSALNVTDGSVLWHNTTFRTGSGDSFSVHNGHLYTERTTNGGRDRTLFTLDGATGKMRWQIPISLASLLSELLVEDGVVYIVAREFLLALNEQSGEIIWRQTVSDTLLHHPELANSILSVESPGPYPTVAMWPGPPRKPDTLAALDARTGQIRWVVPDYRRVPGTHRPLPIVDGLLLATGREGVVGLDVQTGKIAWSYPLQYVIWGSILHGTLYLLESVNLPQEQEALRAKSPCTLKGFHPATGQLLSSHLLATGESTFRVSGIGNGLLYQYFPAPRVGFSPSYKYSLVAYHLSDGSRAWSFSIPPLS
jgi:outer membrane protein assembly factor BamB